MAEERHTWFSVTRMISPFVNGSCPVVVAGKLCKATTVRSAGVPSPTMSEGIDGTGGAGSPTSTTADPLSDTFSGTSAIPLQYSTIMT